MQPRVIGGQPPAPSRQASRRRQINTRGKKDWPLQMHLVIGSLSLPGRACRGRASSQSARVVFCHAFFSFAWSEKKASIPHSRGEEAFFDNAC